VSPRRSLRDSLKWAFVMNWGQRGIATAFTFVLAAILGPHDFGLVAMALAFVALIQVVLEQGISTAIIQRDRLDDEHLDSAFWLNLVWCLLLGAVSVGLSAWWAGVNDAPDLRNVIVALSGLLVIWGLMIVQMSLLQRETRFRELAVSWNVGALVGGVCGLALALAGAGVWAFVAQQLVMDAVALVLMWGAARWRPHFRFSWPHARELVGFSANVFVANLGGFVNRRSDTLLMGLFFGPTAVGLYRLADRVVDLVLEFTMRPVGLISLPHFSRLQNDPERLRVSVEKCLRATLLIAVPVLFVVAATSEYVLALLGSQWLAATDTLALLCVVGMVKGLVFFTGPLLFAVARPLLRAAVLWALGGLSAVTVVLVGAALTDASLDDQIFGMAASRALLFLLAILPINLALLIRFGGVRLRTLLPALPGPLASGLSAFAIVAGLDASGWLDSLSPLPALLIAVGVAGAVALTVVLLLDPLARSEARALREQLGRRRGAGKPPIPQGSLRG
jgi:O-antigen/teichoic acid export membrane protein